MMSDLRVFYVIYLPEGMFRTCLDAIRVVARPQTRFSAHITVRGPYPEQMDVERLSEKLRGAVVRVADVGTFFSERQNTVFFHCSCPELLPVWEKSDYGYNPHVTLYDGESRSFAEALVEVVERYPMRFSFRATGLEPLVSIKGSPQPPLRDQLDMGILAEILGDWPSEAELDTMSESRRLDLVSRLTRHLVRSTTARVSA